MIPVFKRKVFLKENDCRWRTDLLLAFSVSVWLFSKTKSQKCFFPAASNEDWSLTFWSIFSALEFTSKILPNYRVCNSSKRKKILSFWFSTAFSSQSPRLLPNIHLYWRPHFWQSKQPTLPFTVRPHRRQFSRFTKNCNPHKFLANTSLWRTNDFRIL